MIAPDLPEPGCESLISGMARFVNEARQSAPRHPTVLVGHSMGCRVALEAARQQPEGLIGLVLIEGSQRAIGQPADIASSDGDKAASDNKAALMQSFLDMFSDNTPDEFRALALRRVTDIGVSAIGKLVRGMAHWDATHAVDALNSLQAPTLVVQSTFRAAGQRRRPIEQGEMSPWLRLVSAHKPDAEIVWLTGCGHFPQIEAPETINALLGRFIKALQ